MRTYRGNRYPQSHQDCLILLSGLEVSRSVGPHGHISRPIPPIPLPPPSSTLEGIVPSQEVVAATQPITFTYFGIPCITWFPTGRVLLNSHGLFTRPLLSPPASTSTLAGVQILSQDLHHRMTLCGIPLHPHSSATSDRQIQLYTTTAHDFVDFMSLYKVTSNLWSPSVSYLRRSTPSSPTPSSTQINTQMTMATASLLNANASANRASTGQSQEALAGDSGREVAIPF